MVKSKERKSFKSKGNEAPPQDSEVVKVLYSRIEKTLKSIQHIYTVDTKQFVECQASIRLSHRNATECAALVVTRQTLTQKVVDHLAAQFHHVDNSGVGAQLLELGNEISTTLNIPPSAAVREKYFPYSCAHRKVEIPDTTMSPEGALDICIALDGIVNTGKKGTSEWKACYAELGHLLVERMTPDGAIGTMIQQAWTAFSMVQISENHHDSDKVTKKFATQQKKLEAAFLQYYESKIEGEISENALKLAKKRGDTSTAHQTKVNQYHEKNQKDTEELVREEGLMIDILEYSWLVQRNYMPEIWSDLKTTASILNTLIESINRCRTDALIDQERENRSIHDYQELSPLSDSLLSAKFQDKRCLLKKYDLASNTRAFCAEAVMDQRLNAHNKTKVSSAFFDNSNLYVHYDTAMTSLKDYFNIQTFNDTAHHGIFLIRGMLHCVQQCHKQKIVLGEIDTDSWLVCENGLPTLHNFPRMRILSNDTSSKGIEPVVKTARKFNPPEIKDGYIWTRACDVYALGKTLACVADAAHASFKICEADTVFAELYNAMCASDPSERMNIDAALVKSDELLWQLTRERGIVMEHFESVKDRMAAFKKARDEMQFAQAQAKQDMLKAEKIKHDLAQKQDLINQKHRKLEAFAGEAEGRARLDELLKPPSYWTSSLESDSATVVRFVPIAKTSPLFDVFRDIITPLCPEDFGQPDFEKEPAMKNQDPYSVLDLIGVWRLENASLWRNYAVERENVQTTIEMRNLKKRIPVFVRSTALSSCTEKLPGVDNLVHDCNEEYLLHAVEPGELLSVASSGMNERHKEGLYYGRGLFFADDIVKADADQTKADAAYGGFPELHRRLFTKDGEFEFPDPPAKLFYVTLCRMVVGFPVRTVLTLDGKQKMINVIDFPESPVYATNHRSELSFIPDTEPGIHFHSMIAEQGSIAKYRDFVQFHSTRAYPEYVIAYTRL